MPTNCSQAGMPPRALRMPVHVSLGAYGRVPHRVAIAEALGNPPTESLLGKLSTARMQICPQNTGLFSVEMAEELRKDLPDIEWRLHANVRVLGQHRMVDLCDWKQEQAYFAELARVSRVLGAPAYSAHAGKRERASVQEVIRYAREAEDLFGIPVAIEGHYPTPRNTWLFSSWAEYRLLLESGAHYALDLSHLNILACVTGFRDYGLVWDMLECERCIEVHVSGNDGASDQHVPLSPHDLPWWMSLLPLAHAGAMVFSEGRRDSLATTSRL